MFCFPGSDGTKSGSEIRSGTGVRRSGNGTRMDTGGTRTAKDPGEE